MSTLIVKNDNLGWIVLTSILIIAIVVILFFFFRQGIELIDPSQCTAKADYGVIPGITYSSLRTCNNQECVFRNLTLEEAIAKCNQEQQCMAFSYNSSNSVMTFVNLSTEKVQSNSNLYIKQRWS